MNICNLTGGEIRGFLHNAAVVLDTINHHDWRLLDSPSYKEALNGIGDVTKKMKSAGCSCGRHGDDPYELAEGISVSLMKKDGTLAENFLYEIGFCLLENA